MEESQEGTQKKLHGKGLDILHWMDPGSVARPGLWCEFKEKHLKISETQWLKT